MMDILANTIEHADTILLLLKGHETRFSVSLQNMLKRMTIIFGKDWWDNVVVGVSFWVYDEYSIDDILEENARQKREIQQVNNVVSNDIAQLKHSLAPLGTIIAWVTKPAKV